MNHTRTFFLLTWLCFTSLLEAQQPGLPPGHLSNTINFTEPLLLEILHNKKGTCGQKDGSIEVIGKGGIPPYQFSLNGNSFQVSNKFAGLSPGSYLLYVIDEHGSIGELTYTLEGHSPVNLEVAKTLPTSCGEDNGVLSIEIAGATPPVFYSLDDQPLQASPLFESLSAGQYALRVIDVSGCRLDTTVNIERTGCPIYIPNIFTPNGDGINDVFKLETVDAKDVLIRRFYIFDRWGNNVFEKYNFHIRETDVWWDGTYKRFTMDRGQFAYYVEAEFENGDREVFKGNVTLIR